MTSKLLYILFLLSVTITVQAKENKVLIIGIDGCRPDALVVANTPNIDKLIANASYSLDAINEGTTISGPSWSAMLTGVWQEKHGVVDNSFTGENYEQYPHFFKYVEQYNPELHTASICQWGPINDHIANQFADYVKNVSGEIQLISETVNYLSNNNPDALFIHFDDVDGAGHGFGYGPHVPQYLVAIEEVDAGIGQILNALEARSNYAEEDWLIIVSTDHGGIGYGHGGNSIEERNVFIICSGDDIPNKEIKKDSTLSIVPPPENCLQDSVELYFDGTSKATTELNSAFNFGTDKNFSVECRVRTTHSADVAIVTDKDWYTGRNKGFVFSFGGGKGPWKVNVGDGINRIDINGNVVHDGEWHTLSATFDRDGQVIVYEDGVAVDSTSMSSIGNIYSGFPLSFGADAKNSYAYRGSIAEVRMFNKVISKQAINTWACKTIDSTHVSFDSLIGYWRLTEGNNSGSIKDLSYIGADGIISGIEWKNAIDTTEIWTYDYGKTPRIVDVAVSALEHLCVPLKSEWGLDGKALGASCLSTGLNEPNSTLEFHVNVYPNPAHDMVTFELKVGIAQETKLLLFDAHGISIDCRWFDSDKLDYSCSGLSNGMYFYEIETRSEVINKGKFLLK